jgi:hypothetical protein
MDTLQLKVSGAGPVTGGLRAVIKKGTLHFVINLVIGVFKQAGHKAPIASLQQILCNCHYLRCFSRRSADINRMTVTRLLLAIRT